MTATHDLFTRLCVAHGLPEPVREHRFYGTRRWRFDYAWPAQWIALEVEGGVWTRGRHTRGAGYIGDLEKYREAAILGWCVIRVTPSELRTAAVDLVRRAMASASADGPQRQPDGLWDAPRPGGVSGDGPQRQAKARRRSAL